MVAKVVMKAVRMWNRRFCYNLSVGHVVPVLESTCHRDTEGHDVKGHGGNQHDHEDNPEDVSSEPSSRDSIDLPESIGATGTGFLVCDVVRQHGREGGGHSGVLLQNFHGIHHGCNDMMVGLGM